MSLAGLEDTPIWKIAGGESAWIGGYPFQVTVMDKGQYICGGAIINTIFILTAAHCVYGKSSSRISITAGEFDRSRVEGSEQERTAASIHVHEQFSPTVHDNDIALIRLSTALTFTENVYAIPFHKNPMNWRGSATVSGWGQLKHGGTYENILQKVDIPIVNNTACQTQYGTRVAVLNNHMCAGGLGKDACKGDSGGPFTGYVVGNYERVITGIASFGLPCRDSSSPAPGVYTNVSKYGQWVINIMKQYASSAVNSCRASESWCGGEGRCIPSVWLGGTEDCTKNVFSCPADKFRCVGQERCINLSWKCDGDRDCSDGSDEANCLPKCEANQYRCNSGKCIKQTWKCDGDRDCPTGEDEIGCPQLCPGGQFRCHSGKCIRQSWKCDNDRDCPTGEDENNCS